MCPTVLLFSFFIFHGTENKQRLWRHIRLLPCLLCMSTSSFSSLFLRVHWKRGGVIFSGKLQAVWVANKRRKSSRYIVQKLWEPSCRCSMQIHVDVWKVWISSRYRNHNYEGCWDSYAFDLLYLNYHLSMWGWMRVMPWSLITFCQIPCLSDNASPFRLLRFESGVNSQRSAHKKSCFCFSTVIQKKARTQKTHIECHNREQKSHPKINLINQT